jgi:hypothetical protein
MDAVGWDSFARGLGLALADAAGGPESHLIVAPTGLWGQIPVCLLPGADGKPLIDNHLVTIVPSGRWRGSQGGGEEAREVARKPGRWRGSQGGGEEAREVARKPGRWLRVLEWYPRSKVTRHVSASSCASFRAAGDPRRVSGPFTGRAGWQRDRLVFRCNSSEMNESCYKVPITGEITVL